MRTLVTRLALVSLLSAICPFVPVAAQAAVFQAGTAAELIAAINAANATPEVDVIELTASVTLAAVDHDDATTGPSGLPAVVTPIVILGNGFAIERSAEAPPFRLLDVLGGFFGNGYLTLDRVTLRGGRAAGPDDCFLQVKNCGGALLSFLGQVTMRNGTALEGNRAFGGGGFFNAGNAALHDVVLRGNRAAHGGAIYNTGGQIGDPATVQIQGALAQDNEAEFDGGVIHNEAELAIADSAFTNNAVTGVPPFGGGGGAVYNTTFNGQMVAARTRFAENRAMRGGALSNYNASDMTLDNCDVEDNVAINFGDGGGIWSDNNATLVARNSRIVRNRTEALGFPKGGGIFAGGGLNSALVLENSVVGHNVANDDGGGIYMHSSNSSVISTISASRIHDNEASNGHGGGIYKDGISPLNIVGSVITGNVARREGGGLYVDNQTANAAVHSIVGSTIADNLARSQGGGLNSVAFTTTILVDATTISGNRVVTAGAIGEGGAGIRSEHGVILVTNSTIHGNVVDNGTGTPTGSGAAVHTNNQGVVRLTNATVTGNSARDTGGLRGLGTIEVADSIVAGNPSVTVNAIFGPNCMAVGTITDLGGNFTDDGTNCPAGFTASASLNLGVLADNGGPTQTRALGAGSAAIDGGVGCALGTDQRGVARDAACDSGAYEGDVVVPTVSFDVPTSAVGEDPGGPHAVSVTLDNTLGTLAAGSVDVFVGVGGTATGEGVDYSVTSARPVHFSGATWPAPGTAVTQTVDLDVVFDRFVEGPETVVLGLSGAGIQGPASVGAIAEHTVTILDALSDLVVTKSVALTGDGGTPGVFDPGDVVTYTITVTNAGASDAADVTIDDVLDGLSLDAGAAVVGASVGVYSATTGEWSADGAGAGNGFALAAGDTATLTIAAPILPGAVGNTVSNTAAVSRAFPPGAADAEGANDSAEATFTICDASPPTIQVTLDRNRLWPPNHKLVRVTATVTVGDDSDPSPSVQLLSVTSNEADDGLGDGDTDGDIVVVDRFTFDLRAERAGTGSGRVYTITYEATDRCGNASRGVARVIVPRQAAKKGL